MPIYEYVCLECKKKIEVKASISEKEKGLKVICPNCNSSKTAQVFGNIMIMEGSKNKSNFPVCGPQSGAGCCG